MVDMPGEDKDMALKLKNLELQMGMLRENHDEEIKELNGTITELELSGKREDGLAARLVKLEQSFSQLGNMDLGTSRSNSRQASGESEFEAQVTSASREKELEITFGDGDTSPSTLERFINHYQLVDEVNSERGLKVWKKASYRALMVRMALRGAPADYIAQEATLNSSWVKDDTTLLERLRQRYINNAAIELHIIEFERASQKEGEPLGEWMVRLQKLMQNAYSDYPDSIKQSRIAWQFLNGARDKDVREELIEKGWMTDRKTAKTYDEILKIAEGAVNRKIAARATGKSGPTSSRPGGMFNAVQSRPGPGSTSSSGNSNRSSGSAGRERVSDPRQGKDSRTAREGSNWTCHHCKTSDHSGGWKRCPKFRRDYPDWKMGQPCPLF